MSCFIPRTAHIFFISFHHLCCFFLFKPTLTTSYQLGSTLLNQWSKRARLAYFQLCITFLDFGRDALNGSAMSYRGPECSSSVHPQTETAISALIPLSLNQLSSDCRLIINRRCEQQEGGASWLIAVCLRWLHQGFLLSLTSHRAIRRKNSQKPTSVSRISFTLGWIW